VPPGTIVRRRDAGGGEAPLAELVVPGERALLALGGRGGRGNASFKTGRNKCAAPRAHAPVPAGAAGRSLRCRRPCGARARRGRGRAGLTGAARAARSAPTLAEHGEAGAEMWADLELQLVADVGIVGVPNAGKSTLLGVVSAARPKVADYPFTTLVPNLGVCQLDFRTTVFADIPGAALGACYGDHALGAPGPCPAPAGGQAASGGGPRRAAGGRALGARAGPRVPAALPALARAGARGRRHQPRPARRLQGHPHRAGAVRPRAGRQAAGALAAARTSLAGRPFKRTRQVLPSPRGCACQVNNAAAGARWWRTTRWTCRTRATTTRTSGTRCWGRAWARPTCWPSARRRARASRRSCAACTRCSTRCPRRRGPARLPRCAPPAAATRPCQRLCWPAAPRSGLGAAAAPRPAAARLQGHSRAGARAHDGGRERDADAAAERVRRAHRRV